MEDRRQQAYPSLCTLQVHVRTGFYWNSFFSGREWGKGGQRLRAFACRSSFTKRHGMVSGGEDGGFLSSSRANIHQERKSSRFLSSIHCAPNSRPCPGNAGINSHLWRPKRLHSGIRRPPWSSLWALKSFIAWILNYCGGSVANPFPWSHFPLTQICSRHYAEFRGSSRASSWVPPLGYIPCGNKSPFGEHPNVCSIPPEILYDLKVPLLYDSCLTLLVSPISWSKLPGSNARFSLDTPSSRKLSLMSLADWAWWLDSVAHCIGFYHFMFLESRGSFSFNFIPPPVP